MQTVLVIFLLAAALVYLGWRAYAIFSGRKKKGCEKCGISEKKEGGSPDR